VRPSSFRSICEQAFRESKDRAVGSGVGGVREGQAGTVSDVPGAQPVNGSFLRCEQERVVGVVRGPDEGAGASDDGAQGGVVGHVGQDARDAVGAFQVQEAIAVLATRS
jgi:hypothetical protein